MFGLLVVGLLLGLGVGFLLWVWYNLGVDRGVKSSRTLLKEGRQRAFLDALREDPSLSLSGGCRRVGVAVKTMEAWRQDERFAGRLASVRAQRVLERPPAVGSFAEWRLKYVNLEKVSPSSGRVGFEGVTYPYMEDFVGWLSDPSKMFVGALFPIRHGKTKLVEQFAVYSLCKDPSTRILIVCGNQKHAKERAWAIQQMLEDEELFPDLHRDFGLWIGKGDTWGLTEFRVRGKRDSERSPSVAVYGVTSKVYGARADLIILDDIDDPTNDVVKREGIERNLNGSILNRLTRDGRVVAIGTRCGPDDIYGKLLEMPAWKWDVKSVYPDGENVLCPEMYSAEEVEQMREAMGSEEKFQLIFMNNPISISGSLFPLPLVDSAKGNFGIGDAPEDWPRYISVDPAPASRAAVLTVAENPESGEIRVIDLEVIVAGGYEGLIDAIRRQAHAHKPKMLIIEEQGGSFSISDNPHWKDVLTYELDGLSAYYFKTGGAKNDPSYGTALIRSMMGGGKLRIAWSPFQVDSSLMEREQKVTQAKMRPLIDDLVGFQPVFTNRRRYDTVMALWFVVKVLTERRLKGGSRRVASFVNPIVANRPWMRRKSLV